MGAQAISAEFNKAIPDIIRNSLSLVDESISRVGGEGSHGQ